MEFAEPERLIYSFQDRLLIKRQPGFFNVLYKLYSKQNFQIKSHSRKTRFDLTEKCVPLLEDRLILKCELTGSHDTKSCRWAL
jgi:hypothetical protein